MPDQEHKTCKYCGRPMKDLSQGLGMGRHYYCDKCHSHFYEKTDSGLNPTKIVDARWYSRNEWFEYINDRPRTIDDW